MRSTRSQRVGGLARALRQVLACAALLGAGAARLHALTATLSVNTAGTVNTFVPSQAFGTNTDHGTFLTQYQALQPTLQAAGVGFLRYPGGSGSDVYHWNGTGTYNGGVWVPSETSATQGFNCGASNMGTTASGLSLVDDGLTSTAWVSNPDTDFPNGQWVYVDLGSQQSVDQVQIWWGSPYAAAFEVQYWNPAYGANQWSPYQAVQNQWINTSAGTVTGVAGEQTVNFSSVTSEYIRIYMTSSSAGTDGAYSVEELEVFNGATQLSTNAATGQSPVTASSMSPTSQATSGGNMGFDEFMTLCNAYNPPATPLITVNFGTGSAQEAAAWVYYANVVKGYHVKYWEIGNEMMGNWETGGPLSATDYGRRFAEYYAAMTAVDPTIKLLGPLSGPTDASNNLNADSFIQDFAARLVSGGVPQALGSLDIHVYASSDDDVDADLLATPASWTGWAGAVNSALSAAGIPNPTSVPVVLSEYNANSAGTNICVRLVNGLWVVNWLGQFLTNFGSRGWTNFFSWLSAGADESSATGGSFGLFEGTPSAYQNQPFAGFWALQMLSQDWAIPNDTRTHTLVSCGSTAANLIGYADLRPDGVLSLIVSNQDPTNTYSGTVQIAGYSPQASAPTYSFSGADYAWETSTLPYHVVPDTGPTEASQAVGSNFTYSFPPYSLTVFQFQSQGSPTPSPTPSRAYTLTPTPSPTPSATAAPTACATIVCYNGETGAGNVDLAEGNYYVGGCAVAEDAAAAHSGVNGLDLTYSFSAYWGAFTNNFANYSAANAFNLSTYDTLEFWVRTKSGALNNFAVLLGDASGASSPIGAVQVNTYLPGGINSTWQRVDIPLSAFTGINMAAVEMYEFYMTGVESAYIEVYVDDMVFLRHCATASPTPSPSASPTATPTRTPSPSPSRTATPSATPSFTATASPSPSVTPSVTPSGSPTPSPTASPSPTGTPTLSPSASSTATPALTPSPSPSRTATPSATPSFTATASPSPSLSPSVTSSATPSKSPTPSPTASPSPSGTPTVTLSFTASPTPNLSQSPTDSPTPTLSATVSGTATDSPTYSATATDSSTPSVTATDTPSVTPSDSATRSPSATASTTVTATDTATATPTVTSSFTQVAASPTPSGTVTSAPSSTATSSATPPDSATVSPSAIASATVTAADTGTISLTVTSSFTQVVASPTASPGVGGFSPVSASDAGGFTITVTGTGLPVGAQIAVTVNGGIVALATSERTAGGVETLTAAAPAFGAAASTAVTVVDTAVSGTTALDGWSGTMALMKAAATPSGGSDTIIASEPFPDPWTGEGPFAIAVELAGPAENVVVKIYTKALLLVGAYEAGPGGGGWNDLVPPPGLMASIPNGLYYYTISAERNGQGLKPAVGRIYLLRAD